MLLQDLKMVNIYIYEPIENIHKDQILKYSKIPADIDPKIFQKAQIKCKKNCRKIRLCWNNVC